MMQTLSSEKGALAGDFGSAGREKRRFLASKQWQILRMKVFTRDQWRCVQCGRPGRLECDHVVPVSEGGALDSLDNLQSLCRDCHISKHMHPERRAWIRLRDGK